MVDKKLYTTVISQTFSPCGNFLLAGNTAGEIAIYDLQQVLSSGEENATTTVRTPAYHFTPSDESQVYSLAATGGFLIVGSSGEILGFDWDTVTAIKKPVLSWSMTIPSSKDELEKADVNSMSLKLEDEKLYAGCGDNKIRVFDLYGGKLARTFKGHSDYVHCVQIYGNTLVSASEDGTARIWDVRQKDEVQIFKPHLESQLARPALGKWLAAAAINSDWVVCGGGPHLSLWHLRSMCVAQSYTSLNDNGIHVAMLYEDRVLAGGASPHLYHLSLSGNMVAEVPSSSTCLYSVVLQEKPSKVLCMAGSSSKIDLCTNFNYRDQILSFCK